jgi:trimeric autotransporter adhesin
VHNDGLANATGVKVTDVLPAGAMLLSASASQGTCSGTTTVTCALGNMANGSSATASINVKLTNSGTITNTVKASATQGDPSLVNNSATVESAVYPQLSSVTLNPSTVTGSKAADATLTLSGPAPASGVVVNLSSSNTAAATVPAKITVPGGVASKTFKVATSAVSSNATANINATYDGLTRAAALTVTPPALNGLSLTPTTLIGGCTTSTGKISLNGKAPAGGAVVQLTNANSAARVPSSVTVPAGALTATFVITTSTLSVERTGAVMASYGGESRSVSLRVRPIGVLSLTLSPNPVVGPNDVTGTVTLECAAPSGGINVALWSSNTSLASPTVNAINIPAGSSTKTFTIHTMDVTAPRAALIKATANTISKSVPLKIN